ncbi:MAG TPA: beta-L-arabinofuranosidase domain-containing protein [Candidatus Didemnitutus sp.]|nr:beta-L-arabinofuranosidase domain-containing protein [Candidatus Didemnitutus sp.]
MSHLVPPGALSCVLLFGVSTVTCPAQAILSQAARQDPGVQVLHVAEQLPEAKLTAPAAGDVTLLPGLFRDRRELTKAYVLRLKTENILQNHLLEAGVRIDRPYEQMHQGWESPHCQLRGHFAGHWLSSAAQFAATDHDPLLSARVQEAVSELAKCQQLNHGQWVGSIPEKYFAILADGKPVWSPQYTLHKTMMGLLDAYRFTKDADALTVLRNSADWFDAWSEKMIREGHGTAVYGGECAGMLELWSNFYGITKDERYLRLASRYAMPDLFRELLAGNDPLTNDHANASIPWIQGAARLYEVTGDARYRQIVEAFWQQGVERRGMFATTGNNAGEFWIPPQQFGRFLGNETQEHCTVYNMIRVAEYLYRWTGEARYADYIERALYNGILAQQNPNTGLVAYFLPLQPGGKKEWGSELRDFWCCHGTLVQAQAMYESLIYHQTRDGIVVSQFIPSTAVLGAGGQQIRIVQKIDPSDDKANFSRKDDVTSLAVELNITSEKASRWTLRIRQPAWAIGPGKITIDGAPETASPNKDGFLEISREWKTARVRVAFAKRIVREPLPGDPSRFALLDGPVVLAALTDKEPEIAAKDAVTPAYQHQYIDGREWQSGHFLVRTRQGSVAVRPLYEIADERYCVYLSAPQ